MCIIDDDGKGDEENGGYIGLEMLATNNHEIQVDIR